MTPPRTTQQVVVGVIEREGRFLLGKRPEGAHLAGTWEFPGGKVRPGETFETALRRELGEEIGVDFRQCIRLHTEEHAYADLAVTVHFFLCVDVLGEVRSGEGQLWTWFSRRELAALDVPAANRPFLRFLLEQGA